MLLDCIKESIGLMCKLYTQAGNFCSRFKSMVEIKSVAKISNSRLRPFWVLVVRPFTYSVENPPRFRHNFPL